MNTKVIPWKHHPSPFGELSLENSVELFKSNNGRISEGTIGETSLKNYWKISKGIAGDISEEIYGGIKKNPCNIFKEFFLGISKGIYWGGLLLKTTQNSSGKF